MSAFFHVVDVNPNDVTGGGGCIVAEMKQTDCHGPYIVCFHTEMASNLSPHPVICARHVREFAAALDGESLSGGEKSGDSVPEIEGTL